MLLSSRSRAYAHAIKDALTGKKPIASQSESLGLTPEASINTLGELHTLNIADGMTPVGRKLIAESPYASVDNGTQGCLGYLYSAQWPDDEGELPVVRTHGSTRLRIEPKLILRFSDAPDPGAGIDGFIDAIDAIAMGAELLLLPFDNASWRFEDKICANGFSKGIHAGELKTLSRSSKRNFSMLLEHSTFSLSRTNGMNSAMVGFTPGHKSALSSIASLYELLRQRGELERRPIAKGDVVALNALCAAQPVSAGDEWISVLTCLDLPSLRIRFSK